MEYRYITIGDDGKKQLILNRINALEQERYLLELEAIACAHVGDEQAAAKAQQQADLVQGKIVAIADEYDKFNQTPAEETNGAEKPAEKKAPVRRKSNATGSKQSSN